MIFFLHGATGRNKFSGWVQDVLHADRKRTFVGVYPQGEQDENGVTGWHYGHRDTAFDEGAFISAIVRRLRTLGSTGRLYAWGFSNGAGLAYKLAVNGRMGFRGIAATVTALTASPETFGTGEIAFNYPTTGSSTRPVAVLSIMGSADRTIPLRGGPFHNSKLVFADALDSIGLWAKVNQCRGRTTSPIELTYRDSHEAVDVQTTATRTMFEGCLLPTQYIEVPCAGHVGARTIDRQDSMRYALNFLLGVDAACDRRGLCETLPSYTPPTATLWPDYTTPADCEDTTHSCACLPSFDVTAGTIGLPPPPSSPAMSTRPPRPRGQHKVNWAVAGRQGAPHDDASGDPRGGGSGGGGPPCTSSCSVEFGRCFGYHNDYERCRLELDLAIPRHPMTLAGCVAHCANTMQMARALQLRDRGGGNSGGGGRGLAAAGSLDAGGLPMHITRATVRSFSQRPHLLPMCMVAFMLAVALALRRRCCRPFASKGLGRRSLEAAE